MKKQPLRFKTIRSRFSEGLLLLFLLLLPTQLGRHFFLSFSYINGVRVDYLAPTLYLTDIIVLLLVAVNIRMVFKYLLTKRSLLVAGLLTLSVLLSQSKIISFYQGAKYLEFFFVFILFYRSRLKNRLLLLVLFLGSFVELALAIGQFINKHSLQGIYYFLGERYFSLITPGIAKAAINGVEFLRPYGSFSHPNSLAGFYLLIYFFVLTNRRFQFSIWLKNMLLFFSSVLIIISFSKIAIIVYLTLNILYFIFNTKLTCRLCLVAKIAVLVTLTLIVFKVQSDPLTVQKRLELINNSFNIIINRPFFGVGPGTYLLSQSDFISRFNLFFNQPVHNVFLLFLAENGIFIGGIIFWLLAIAVKNKLRSIGYVVLVIVITGLFDHYWLTLQQNFLLIAAVMGVFGSRSPPARLNQEVH